MIRRYKAYSEYKDSGFEWLDVIPTHWKVNKVKRLTDFQVGWTPSTGKDDNFVGYNLWANISDLKGKYLNDTAKRISDVAAQKASMDITPKGSLLYSFKLSVGTVSFADKDMYTNEAIASFLSTSKLPLSYLYYSLPIFVIENASTNIYGAKILNQELIKNATLIEPTYLEAEKIANFLDHETDKIDTLIAKQEKLIVLLKEKRQAVISHAVTKGLPSVNGEADAPMKDSGVDWLGEVPEHWCVSKLRFISSFGRGLGITKANLQDSGIPCVNYGEVHSKYGFEVRVDKHPLKCVSENYLKISPECLLNEGDIIFADTSEDQDGAGNFTQLNGKKNVFAGYHTVVVRFSIDLHNRFIAYVFDSESFRNQIRTSVKGIKVYSVTQAILKNATIWLPSVSEQRVIAEYLDNLTSKIDRLISHQIDTIELMKERKTALISAAVTGKIDVRDFVAKQEEA